MKKTLSIILALVCILYSAALLAYCGSSTTAGKSDAPTTPSATPSESTTPSTKVITIAVPNDTTNESRALGLLEFNGLIKLNAAAGQTATVLDIAENPHKFDFVEVEAAQVPRTLADVDLGVINSNYALQAGVDVVGTPIAYESTEVAYPNIIAIREGDDREELKTLVEVLQGDEIVNFINETYKGAVVPTK